MAHYLLTPLPPTCSAPFSCIHNQEPCTSSYPSSTPQSPHHYLPITTPLCCAFVQGSQSFKLSLLLVPSALVLSAPLCAVTLLQTPTRSLVSVCSWSVSLNRQPPKQARSMNPPIEIEKPSRQSLILWVVPVSSHSFSFVSTLNHCCITRVDPATLPAFFSPLDPGARVFLGLTRLIR